MREHPKQLDNGPLSPLESAILSAAQYVYVSDDLRPRTIEAAKELASDRKIKRGASSSLLSSLLFIVFIGIPLSLAFERNARTYLSSTQAIQKQTVELSSQPGVGSNWAFYEVVTRLRTEQASRFEKLKAAAGR